MELLLPVLWPGTFGIIGSGDGKRSLFFSGITDVVNNRAIAPNTLAAQDIIMSRDPGQLILEVTGGLDFGTNAKVFLFKNNTGGCPSGASQYLGGWAIMNFLLRLTCALLLIAPAARASMCINGHPSLELDYKNSEYVVEATVVHITRDVPTSYVYDGHQYDDLDDEVTVRVLSSYKGPSKAELTFKNPHSSAALPVQEGSKYLLFLSRSAPSEKLYVDTCGSSGLMDAMRHQAEIRLRAWSRTKPDFVANHD